MNDLCAEDLTDDYLQRRIRVAGRVGVLRSLYVVGDFVQLVVDDGGPTTVDTVGAGAPVTLLD